MHALHAPMLFMLPQPGRRAPLRVRKWSPGRPGVLPKVTQTPPPLCPHSSPFQD